MLRKEDINAAEFRKIRKEIEDLNIDKLAKGKTNQLFELLKQVSQCIFFNFQKVKKKLYSTPWLI